jgi:exopolysaccharide production protein ExoZ
LKTLASIQYLRGLAALAVVLFHACQWSRVNFDVGAGGVDVFFIISGLVMWLTTAERPVGPWVFLWRRAMRVAPLYWLVTLALAGLAIWGILRPDVVFDGPHLLLSLAFVPHISPDGLVFPFLPPGWSLTYEAVFYLVFALALAAPRFARFAVMTTILTTVAAFGFLYHPAYPLLFNPMMLQFVAGSALARAYLAERLPGRVAGWILLTAGVGAFAAMRVAGFHSDLWRPLIWGVPALAIVTGALSIEAGGGLFGSRTLKLLGDGSYSIYLCHWPVIVLMQKTLGIKNAWIFIPLSAALATLVGLICRQGVEKPLIRLLRGRVGGSRTAPEASMAAASP